MESSDTSGPSSSGTSRFGGLWLAGLLFLLITLALWVAMYVVYGEKGKLNEAETTVVALVVAVIVFGGSLVHLALEP